MKFTVLMSIYHKENANYFNEALDSIWEQQSIKPDEIILVQDGPLNHELDKVIHNWSKKLKDKLKLINLPINVGLGQALNEGLKHCSNNWVFRMDTDDLSVNNRFEKQIHFIKNNPNISLLSGQIKEFDGNPEKIISTRAVPLSHKDILQYALFRSPFNHASIAMKKDIILAEGGYKHHLLMEDYNLWLRILSKNYEVANLPDTLLYVRADAMHGRRRGLLYIKSEWQLLKLKRQLKFQSSLPAFVIFLIRSIPRLFPSKLLQLFYKLLRKK